MLDLIPILFATVFASTSLHAQQIAYRCNDCTTEKIQSLATTMGVLWPGSTTFVYDLQKTLLYAVQSTCTEANQGGAFVGGAVTDITHNGSDVSDAFIAEATAIAKRSDSEVIAGSPLSVAYASSYTFVTTSAYQNSAYKSLSSAYRSSADTHSADLLHAADALILKSDDIVLRSEVTLSDGGVATVDYSINSSSFGLNKVVDSHANAVPLLPEQIPGRYRCGTSCASGIGQVMHILGAQIVGPPKSCSNPSMTCANQGKAQISCSVDCD